MPDYDYDEYTRRHEEYEARRAAGEFDLPANNENAASSEPATSALESEDDMSW